MSRPDVEAVLDTIKEFDRIGRASFMEKYGFADRNITYEVEIGSRRYPSKSIFGAAYARMPGEVARNSETCNGTEAREHLARLGLKIVGGDIPTGEPPPPQSQADRIRAFVIRNYIEPARQKGAASSEVISGDVHSAMGLLNALPAVCSVLEGKAFAEQAKVRLVDRHSPIGSDKPSSTIRYRFALVMAAAVAVLGKHARSPATRRKLDELRFVLAEIPLLPVNRLPWKDVRIDRTNRHWESLFRLAQLLLRRDWQATHHAASAPEGLTLLFPMNDLFEKYVAAMMRKALAGSGVEVVDQGGHRACLGAFTGEHLESGEVFRTRPDIILRRRGEMLAIIDTKWKKLARDPLDRKHGVSQADVYQLMAYARLYPTRELMLLYPEVPGEPCGMRKPFGMAGGSERLAIATVDASLDENALVSRLLDLCAGYHALEPNAAT